MFSQNRIILQMHFVHKLNWKIMFQFYDDTIIISNCQIIQINNFFCHNSTSKLNKRLYKMSIEKTINLIVKRLDFVEKWKFRRLIANRRFSFNFFTLDNLKLKMNNVKKISTKNVKRYYFFVTIQFDVKMW